MHTDLHKYQLENIRYNILSYLAGDGDVRTADQVVVGILGQVDAYLDEQVDVSASAEELTELGGSKI